MIVVVVVMKGFVCSLSWINNRNYGFYVCSAVHTEPVNCHWAELPKPNRWLEKALRSFFSCCRKRNILNLRTKKKPQTHNRITNAFCSSNTLKLPLNSYRCYFDIVNVHIYEHLFIYWYIVFTHMISTLIKSNWVISVCLSLSILYYTFMHSYTYI